MMRIILAASLLVVVASAASPPQTCPASHIIYKYVYVDENGANTGEIAYRGPFLKPDQPTAPQAPSYPPIYGLSLPPSSDSGSGSNSGSSPSSNNGVVITKPKPGSYGSSSRSSSGSWKNSNNDGGASYDYYGEPAVFRPAVPHGVRSWSPQKVVPKPQGDSHTLWFGGAKYQEQLPELAASAQLTYNAPSVVLDHCSYITVTASSSSLFVSFGTADGYSAAKSSWAVLAEVYLITHTPGCGDHADGEYCHFLAKSFSFSDASRTITCSGETKKAQEAIDTYEISWGHYVPKPASDPDASSTISFPQGTATSSQGPSSTGGYPGARSTSEFPSGPNASSNSSVSAAPSGTSSSAFAGPSDPSISLTAGPSGTSSSAFPGPSGLTNSTTSGNSTTNGTCVAPVDTKYGFATACLGPYFDSDVDYTIGFTTYENLTSGSNIAGFANKIGSDGLIKFQKRTIELQRLQKRGLGDWLMENIVDPAVDTLKTVASLVPIPGITRDTSIGTGPRTFDFKFPGSVAGDPDAPWPNARIIHKAGPLNDDLSAGDKTKFTNTMSAWCVDCGVEGHLTTEGTIKGALINGITAGSLDVGLDLALSAFLGLAGNFSIDFPAKELKLFEEPLTPLIIPGLLTVGPKISLGLELVPKLALENATILAGATLGWKGAKGRIAFGEGEGSSASGWTPEFKPLFTASGELSIAADLGLPYELFIGVSAVGAKEASAGIAVQIRPALEAKASIEGAISIGGGKSASAEITGGEGGTPDDCHGIKTGLEFKETIQCKVRLGAAIEKTLYDFIKPLNLTLYKGCIPIGNLTKDTAPTNGTDSNNTLTADTPSTPSANIPGMFLKLNDTQDLTAIVNASSISKPFTLPIVDISAYNVTNGIEYVPLQDITKAFMITACGNGNLYLQNFEKTTGLDRRGCGSLWSYDNVTDAIYGDGSGRIAYFYTDAMTKLGVSRLRISSENRVPIGSEFVSFLPYAQQDIAGNDRVLGSKVYLPTDNSANVYGTYACFYTDKTQPPKIFVSNNRETAVATLKSEDIRYSITGGEVSDCSLLSFGQGDDAAGPAWDGTDDSGSFQEEWLEEYDEWDDMLDETDPFDGENSFTEFFDSDPSP